MRHPNEEKMRMLIPSLLNLTDEQKKLTFKIPIIGRGAGMNLISQHLLSQKGAIKSSVGLNKCVKVINNQEYNFILIYESGFPVRFYPMITELIEKSAGVIFVFDTYYISLIEKRLKDFEFANQEFEGKFPTCFVGHSGDRKDESVNLDSYFYPVFDLKKILITSMSNFSEVNEVILLMMQSIIENDNIRLKRNFLSLKI